MTPVRSKNSCSIQRQVDGSYVNQDGAVLSRSLTGVYTFGPPGAKPLPMTTATSMSSEGFHPLGPLTWTRSKRATRVAAAPVDFVVEDDEGELFRPAADVSDEFVRTTHAAVRQWGRERGKTPGERHFREAVARIEQRYGTYAETQHFANAECAQQYSTPK